jgi:hypothetical protein
MINKGNFIFTISKTGGSSVVALRGYTKRKKIAMANSELVKWGVSVVDSKRVETMKHSTMYGILHVWNLHCRNYFSFPDVRNQIHRTMSYYFWVTEIKNSIGISLYSSLKCNDFNTNT